MTTYAALLLSQTTREQALEALYEFIATTPNPIPRETLDTPGTFERAIIYALATLEAQRSEDRLRWVKEAFRSSATRDGLALIALEFFGMPVRSADHATTLVVVTNAKGGLYGPFEPGELRFLNHGTDPVTVYENTEAITISPAGVSSWVSSPIGARAIEPGTASNADVGDIDALETALDGVTVTNTQPAIGQDDETAESINDRISAQISRFGIGATRESTGAPQTSLEAIALNGEDGLGGCVRTDGTRVTVTRARPVRDDTTGTVVLYVADADGPLVISDLDIVREEVQAYGERVCMTVDVANVNVVTVTVQAEITITGTSLSDDEITELVEQSYTALTVSSRIGGFGGELPLEYIEGALRNAAWTTVDVVMTLPASAPVLNENEVAVFDLPDGNLSIVRVA